MKSVPLVGGCLCLDFVNTTGARQSGAPRERLLRYADLLVWSRRAGLIDASHEAWLAQGAIARPAESAHALTQACALRESLYRLFRAIAERADVPSRDVARLNELWREDRRRRELVATESRFELRLRVDDDALDRVRWPIVASAVELLTMGDLDQVKRCQECDWLFLDTSKNHSRTWCKKLCGDRARARRHYQRVRTHQA